MNWYLKVINQYADFSGRARRKEYWMFALFNGIFCIVAMVLDNMLGLAIENVGYGAIYILYMFAVLVPGLAVSVRRMHDIGKSGWIVLVSLIPIAGIIWLLVLLVTEGEPCENSYGANPKESENQGTAQGTAQSMQRGGIVSATEKLPHQSKLRDADDSYNNVHAVQKKQKEQYFILEHKVGSKYHRVGENQRVFTERAEIGRAPECEVCYDEHFETVSRRHAAIIKDGDQWKLLPMSQTNPTLLNGKKVDKEWYLQHGDEIQCAINGPKLVFKLPELS